MKKKALKKSAQKKNNNDVQAQTRSNIERYCNVFEDVVAAVERRKGISWQDKAVELIFQQFFKDQNEALLRETHQAYTDMAKERRIY